MAKNDLNLKITADVKKATAEIKKVNKELSQIKKEINQASKSQTNFNNRIKNMAHLTAGIISIKSAYNSIIGTTANFEQSIAKLGAISKATDTDLKSLTDKARELGKTTQYSASEVAQAMNYEDVRDM